MIIEPVITIWINYYNEPDHLRRWMDAADNLIQEKLPIRVHVIDDGSKQLPAIDLVFMKNVSPNVSLYRVKEDLGFNSHGCRNLAMKITRTEWNILCDIDRGLPLSSLEYIIKKLKQDSQSMRGGYYIFRRSDSISSYALHDYLIHRDDFWLTGGYDEEYTGVHHGDRLFLENLEQFIQRRLLVTCSIDFLRFGRTLVYNDDIDKPVYDNEKMIMYHPTKDPKAGTPSEVNKMIRDRNKRRDFTNKKIIQFEWEQLI